MSNQKKRSGRAARTVSDGRPQTLQSLASFRLHTLARHSERLHAQHYSELVGLNMGESRIIDIVANKKQTLLRYAWEDLRLDRGYVSALINRLIKRGLLAKTVHDSDKRTFNVTLTASGRATHKALKAAAVSLNKEWLSVLSKQQWATFDECLNLLTKNSRRMRAHSATDID